VNATVTRNDATNTQRENARDDNRFQRDGTIAAQRGGTVAAGVYFAPEARAAYQTLGFGASPITLVRGR
jgi:hypothetical protein